jgi:hypothetical protein
MSSNTPFLFRNTASLITCQDNGKDYHLGYLTNLRDDAIGASAGKLTSLPQRYQYITIS